MKKLILLILTIILALPLIGNPIDENTAKQLAQNFWKENNIMGVKGDKIFKKKMGDARFVNVAPHCGYSEFYIFNNEGGKGFVIIAADDCVTPILGYSYDNNFAAENLPPNLKGWLDGYAEQIRMAVEMRATASDEIRADWECLRQGKNLPIRSETQVYPLIATTWNQNYPYNELCPTDYGGPGNHAYAGCVATAMAQIMKYWAYPAQGFGFLQYYHPSYGQLSVNFGETTYNWSSMPSNSSNNAVAKLLYHCGVSVEMDYGPSISNAYVLDFGLNRPCAENALKTYFDYKNTLHGEIKENYSDSQWIALLKNELNNARPILYAGFGTGGHAFVCDGYDPYDCFHFNWGWSGAGQGTNNDAYYYINSLIPENTSHNFSYNQQALIGIEPNNTTYNFDLVYYSTPVMSEDEYWFFDDLSVYAEVWNVGSGAFNGYIGAGVYYEEEPGSGTYYFLEIMDLLDFTSNPLPGNYYWWKNYGCAGGPPYIPGSYAVAMLYSMDGDLWNFIDLGNYDYAYFDIVSSYTINTNSNFTILTGDGSCLYQNTDATINVDVINTSSDTFYGKFRINLANSDGSWVQNIGIFECNAGLQPNYHYTNGLDFTGIITAPPGTYLMELAYQESGSSNWYYAGASNYQNPVRVYVAPEPIYADPYEPNNSQNLAYSFTPNFSGNSATVNTTGSNLHNSSDLDFYKINLNSGYDYTITPRLHDAFNSGNGNTYSVDAMFAYSTDGVNWSDFYDDVMNGNFSVIDGGTVYFDVISYFEGDIGTYLLNVGITRSQHSVNNYTINVSANPAYGGTVMCSKTMITEDFNNYNNGNHVASSALAAGHDYWTTWNDLPESSEDGYVEILNGDRCGHLTYGNDQVLLLGNVNHGVYDIKFDIIVPQGKNGYFSILHHFAGSNSTWALQCYLHLTNDGQTSTSAPGHGTLHAGSNSTADLPCVYDQWMHFRIHVDTDNDIAQLFYNVLGHSENMYAEWQWSLDSFGENVTDCVLDALDFFPPENNASEFYIDNIVVSNQTNYFDYGNTCALTAIPNNGYTFVNWTENGTQVSTNANYTFTVTGNRNLVAHFQQQQQQYTISVSASPNNGGSVSGGGTFNQGASCTVHATANSGYTFVNWTENGTQVSTNANYTFTVTGNRNLVAHFQQQQQQYTISVSANPSNGGSVSGGGTFNQGASCTVHATANSGYTFVNWTENGTQVSTNANYSFTVTGNRNLVANFAQSEHTIQATAGANGIITPSGTVTVTHGANQSFAMIPDTGYEVQDVYIDGNSLGAIASYTFTNVTANHYIHVTFVHVDGVDDNNILSAVVYPNPTSGEVTIECEGLNHIRIVNTFGQTVYNADHEGNQTVIDLSQMAKGIYMMHIEAEDGQMVRKIVVE